MRVPHTLMARSPSQQSPSSCSPPGVFSLVLDALSGVFSGKRFYADPGIRFLKSQSSPGWYCRFTASFTPQPWNLSLPFCLVIQQQLRSLHSLSLYLWGVPWSSVRVPRCSFLQGFLYHGSKALSPPYCSYPAQPAGFCQGLPYQQSCPKVEFLCHSSTLSVVSVPSSGSNLLCDRSTGILRPLVLEKMRRSVFNAIHNISHLGKCSYRILVSRSFVWEGLSKDVKLWSKSCPSCQRGKVQTLIKTPPQQIPVPGRRFSHIYLDLVRPLPQSCGYRFLCTTVDRTSRLQSLSSLQ